MLHLRRFEDITEADLESLIQDKVREGTTIDYKRAINLQPDQQKIELSRDVSSFANASGGHIVYGIEEVDGVPTKINGIPASTNFENLEQQVNQICRSRIDPPVTTIRMRPIPLASGQFVFPIRIDKTWNGPHMITFDAENRCWTRDHSGKRPMDISDLKQAMAYSEGAASRMKRFRMERIGNILARETPIPLSSSQCIIFHFLPLVSFTGNPQVDLDMPDVEMRPINNNSGWGPTYTFEGKMTYSTLTNGPTYTHCLLFRNGIVEFVDSRSLLPRQDGPFKDSKLFFTFHFQSVVDALRIALDMYRKLGIPTPVFGAVSLTEVKGYRMFIPPQFAGIFGKQLNQNILTLPEFVIEDFDEKPEQLLAEPFRIWWQACGHHDCPAWLKKEIRFE